MARDTLPIVARLERLREFLDRLHPSGLLYATYEHRLGAELDRSQLPQHVAVLADGNRRWARDNAPGEPLVAGYRAGAEKLKEFLDWCDEIGIPVVNIAVSYGGRHELRDAVRSLLAQHARNGTPIEELANTLDIEHIAEHLYTKGQPDPDLIIRTSGEQRLSGFLMWQSAHSEFYFCEALWPDFRKVDFLRALRSYASRQRRFGA